MAVQVEAQPVRPPDRSHMLPTDMVLKFLMGVDTYTGNLRYAIDMCMGMLLAYALHYRSYCLAAQVHFTNARVPIEHPFIR